MSAFSLSLNAPPRTFPEHLRALRTGRGFSLRQLARQAGISHDSLGAWERGDRLPRLPELEAALTALGADLNTRRHLVALVPTPRASSHLRLLDAGPEKWARAAGPMPAGGDLLRAMRGRRGWTQTEAAKAAGVSQGRLAEWERSGDWPDAGRLHTLCWALGARPEEVAALTVGVRLDIPTPEDDPVQLDLLDLDDWCERILQTWLGGGPLQELGLITLEARLWPMAGRDDRALPLLLTAYACHARSLSANKRLTEASAYAERALNLAQAGHGDGEYWAWAVIVRGLALRGSEEPTVRGGEAALRRRGKRAAGFLQSWEKEIRRPEHRAWLWADLAKSLRQSGEADAAVELNREACRLAQQSENTHEAPNRWDDLSKLLTGLGRYGEALDALEGARPLADFLEETRVSHLLLEAECQLALGRHSVAHDLAGKALERSTPLEMAPQRVRAESLTRHL